MKMHKIMLCLGLFVSVSQLLHAEDDVHPASYNASRNTASKSLKEVPDELLGLQYVTIKRGTDIKAPGESYTFSIDEKSTVYIAVENRGKPVLGDGWVKTDMTVKWQWSDTVYRKVFEAGQVNIPPHNGVNKNGMYGVPHMAFVKKFEGQADKVVISDLPKKLGAKTGTFEQVAPGPTKANVRYGEHPRNTLDFWQAKSDKPTPLVLVIHGGGWTKGDKSLHYRSVKVSSLLDAGISVASINYRFIQQVPDMKPPVKAPLQDAARALQFIRSKAKEWNIDKDRIAANGSSAGACSSLWLAMHDDMADPKSKDPVARESTRLYCAAVVAAQTTLDPKQMNEWTPNSRYGGHAFGIKNFVQFSKDRDKLLDWIKMYSPYYHVSKDDPPVYLIYQDSPAIGQKPKDPTHTANFGIKLQELCKAKGVPCELVTNVPKKDEPRTATDYLIKTLKR